MPKSQNPYNKIIQKQLQMSLIKKNSKKGAYLQKKDKIIDDPELKLQYNNGISK